MGWYVATSIILGLLGGLWLDRKLGTLPLFTLVGVILGTVAAFYGIYRMMLPLLKLDQGSDKKNKGQQP
ncbi:MAG: AtpZ/AtpI family protein [Chloroflexi bacterium]|nr:AtpZ/AtpI family protein [Chloroflexota bacterium]